MNAKLKLVLFSVIVFTSNLSLADDTIYVRQDNGSGANSYFVLSNTIGGEADDIILTKGSTYTFERTNSGCGFNIGKNFQADHPMVTYTSSSTIWEGEGGANPFEETNRWNSISELGETLTITIANNFENDPSIPIWDSEAKNFEGDYLFYYCYGQFGEGSGLPYGYVSVIDSLLPVDADSDGIVGSEDNCPDISNPDQIDTDGDNIGDVCDADADADADADNDGIFSYVIENDAVTITKCAATRANGESICPDTIALPNFIEGLPVIKIGDGAFKNKSNMTEAIMPEGILEIGNEAFWQTGLNEIIIPDSVVIIGDSSFKNVYAASLKIGSGVKTIGSSAFRGNSITSLVIPNSVITLGQSAFEYNDLIDVTLPAGLEAIPMNLFSDNNLQTINIPNSVEVIGDYAFTKNPLRNITFGESILEIGYQPVDSDYLEYAQFLGDRPLLTNETLGASYITYCPEKTGWPGVAMSGVKPVQDCDADGVLDINDNFPLISVRGYGDTDSDGSPDECNSSCVAMGMIADSDDDNDGLADQFDDLPLDPTEQTDTDGDGIGNNTDIDDDGDGVIDIDDLYPLDPTKQSQKLLDIDGNDKVDALTDGLLILRYLIGLQGAALVNGVVANDATRTTAEEIEAHLETLMPAL